MAKVATEDNLKAFEERRAELKAAADKLAAAQAAPRSWKASPTISSKAGEEGKLFGSTGVRDIVYAITAAGTEVEKSEFVCRKACCG